MKYIKINPADNVAVALEDLSKGEVVEGVQLLTDIPRGHKILHILLLLLILLVSSSCEKLTQWYVGLFTREKTAYAHRVLEFSVEDVKYSVCYNSPAMLAAPEPHLVGASLSRIRNQNGIPDVRLMRAECDREDTLAFGALLTCSQVSKDEAVGYLFCLMPFSKVELNNTINLQPEDVYFFNGEGVPSNRADISSFVIIFSSVSLADYPNQSIVSGTFIMSGVECDGHSFTSSDGIFNIEFGGNISFEPFEYFVDFYKKKYE